MAARAGTAGLWRWSALDVAREAATTAGAEAGIVEVTDMKAMTGYGLLSTPGPVVDEALVSCGGLPTQAKIGRWLTA